MTHAAEDRDSYASHWLYDNDARRGLIGSARAVEAVVQRGGASSDRRPISKRAGRSRPAPASLAS
jgi:hypothetical protein